MANVEGSGDGMMGCVFGTIWRRPSGEMSGPHLSAPADPFLLLLGKLQVFTCDF